MTTRFRPKPWQIVVLLGLLASSAWLASRLRPTRVATVHAERREIVESIVASGRVLAPAKVSIGAQLSGVARRIGAREGEAVKAGQVLVELDDRELRAQAAQAEAALQQARATSRRLDSLTGSVAREELTQAQLAVERAREELGRQQRLAASSANTQKELEDAKRALQQAESQRRSAEERLADTSPAGAERQRAAAQVAQAQAALELARTRLDQARLLAPSDGIVLERHVEPGSFVQVGKTLFVLAPQGETRLVVQLDEKELARVRPGQHALAAAEAARDQKLDAEVQWIAPAVDPQRATIEVRLVVRNAPPFLRPDMTVSVDLEVGRKSGALVVPLAAVRDAATDRPWVLVARQGRAERVSVRLGLRGGAFVEVREGVTPDDELIPVSEPVSIGARVSSRGR